MDEPCSSQNPKFGEIIYIGDAKGRVKEREAFKGLKKFFKFGRKTGGDSGLDTSSLHEEDQPTTASPSPAAQKGEDAPLSLFLCHSFSL